MSRKRKQTLTVRDGLDMEVSSIDMYPYHVDTSLHSFGDEISKDIHKLNFNDLPEMFNETGANHSYDSLTSHSISNNTKLIDSILDFSTVHVSSDLNFSTSEFCLDQFNISGNPVESTVNKELSSENIENLVNYKIPTAPKSTNVKGLITLSRTEEILSKSKTPGSGYQNFKIFDGTMSQCCETDVKVENWLCNQSNAKEEILEERKTTAESPRSVVLLPKVTTAHSLYKDVLSENQEINKVKSPLTRKFLKLGDPTQDPCLKRMRRDSCSQKSFASGTDMSETISDIEIANKMYSNMNSSMCSDKSEVTLRLNLPCEEGTFVCTLKTVILDQSLMVPEEFKDNDEKIKYYTGVPKFENFMALLVCMRLCMKHELMPFQLLLLTFMKLRHNSDWEDLGYRFNISPKIAESVFYSTVALLANCFTGLMPWSDHLMMNKPVGIPNRTSASIYFHSITSCSSKETLEPKLCKTLLAISSLSVIHSEPSIIFISKPFEGTHTDMQLITQNRIFGIMMARDVIMFKEGKEGLTLRVENVEESSTGSPKHAHFSQVKPTVKDLEFRAKAEMLVSDLKCYKILSTVPVSWTNMKNGVFMLNTVIKVIAGIVNLCQDQPFDSKLLGVIATNRNRIQLPM